MLKPFTLMCFLAGLVSTSFAQVANFSVGQTCPNFTVTDVHGETHTLYDITAQGKYVVLDCFFTTCPPCVETAPIFQDFYEKYGCNSGNVYCLALDDGDNNAEVLAFENTYPMPSPGLSGYPSVSGTDGGGNGVIATLGVGAFPTYSLIGPDNKFINIDIWPISDITDIENAFPSGVLAVKSCTVGTSDLAPSVALTLSPNPVQDRLTIVADSKLGGVHTATIFNSVGQAMTTFTLGATDVKTLSVANWAQGTYFLQMPQVKGFSAIKFEVVR